MNLSLKSRLGLRLGIKTKEYKALKLIENKNAYKIYLIVLL